MFASWKFGESSVVICIIANIVYAGFCNCAKVLMVWIDIRNSLK
jgi:hypothetical protein